MDPVVRIFGLSDFLGTHRLLLSKNDLRVSSLNNNNDDDDDKLEFTILQTANCKLQRNNPNCRLQIAFSRLTKSRWKHRWVVVHTHTHTHSRQITTSMHAQLVTSIRFAAQLQMPRQPTDRRKCMPTLLVLHTLLGFRAPISQTPKSNSQIKLQTPNPCPYSQSEDVVRFRQPFHTRLFVFFLHLLFVLSVRSTRPRSTVQSNPKAAAAVVVNARTKQCP